KEAVFRRHWPNHKAELDAATVDQDLRLWVVFTGETPESVSSQSVRSFRTLRDAAVFDVEFATLGPKVPLRARTFTSLANFAETVSDGELILFIGPNDEVDVHLPDVMILEDAWKRDFILTDQFYTEG